MLEVKDFFFRDLTSVSENDSILNVIRIMRLTRLSSLPVVNEHNDYLGCLSESDIVEASLPDYLRYLNNTAFLPDPGRLVENLRRIGDEPVIKIMPADYPVVRPEDSVGYAADLMNRSKRSVLPVVAEGRLLGRFGKTELLGLALEEIVDTETIRNEEGRI